MARPSTKTKALTAEPTRRWRHGPLTATPTGSDYEGHTSPFHPKGGGQKSPRLGVARAARPTKIGAKTAKLSVLESARGWSSATSRLPEPGWDGRDAGWVAWPAPPRRAGRADKTLSNVAGINGWRATGRRVVRSRIARSPRAAADGFAAPSRPHHRLHKPVRALPRRAGAPVISSPAACGRRG